MRVRGITHNKVTRHARKLLNQPFYQTDPDSK